MIETAIVFIIVFFIGYCVGKRQGHADGKVEGKSLAYIILRQQSYEQGCCALCFRDHEDNLLSAAPTVETTHPYARYPQE